MNASDSTLKLQSGAALFGLIGGPLAWFIQLDAGYALASWPCFPKDHRLALPLAGFAWTWPAMIVVLVASVLVGLAALWVSWRNLRRSGGEQTHGGRKQFLALWGVFLGGGFAMASVASSIALIALPRCGG
jgi:hypothetical protein